MRITVSSIALAALALGVHQKASAQAADIPGIRHAEEAMHDAYVHHKTELFASLYADDATFIFNSGRLVDKASRVQTFEKAAAFVGEQDVIQKVRTYGDIAIVTCLTTYPSKDQITALLITRVWERRGGRWQVVSFQSTKTPIPPGAALDQPDKITFAQP